MIVKVKTEESNIATVYIAEFEGNRNVEFVESLQPPFPIDKKWVLIVSTLYGCPVGCGFCDAGIFYKGKISTQDIFEQIDFMVTNRFPSRNIPVEKFKIQFARMGEPALNNAVVEVLELFTSVYNAPGFIPSVSTIAPTGCDLFFENLLDVKKKLYDRTFQLQFSLHTTSESHRNSLIPAKKWSFRQISDYADKFFSPDGKKITLNFALNGKSPFNPHVLADQFDVNKFLIKITPVNPTVTAVRNGLFTNDITPPTEIINTLYHYGYEVIYSLGELEENQIGSNCGQYITHYLESEQEIFSAYNYNLVKV